MEIDYTIDSKKRWAELKNMKMSNLMVLIVEAQQIKPEFGEPCNHCGWCCMTETCPVAKDLGAGEMLPCKFLKTANEDGHYFCSLANENPLVDFGLGIGTGCDAMTQMEQLTRMGVAPCES